MKYNLESYKATLEQMADKQTFRLAEIYPRRFDVFYVLKQNKYIHQIDYGVYEWSGKRPNIRTAKRVAMLTMEYRKTWGNGRTAKQTKMEFKPVKKTEKPTQKQMEKEKASAYATMALIGVTILAIIVNIIIYLNK
jgi:hypothetical protein